MKIRSTAELNEAIDRALAWRKRELELLNSIIERQKRNHEEAFLFRAAIPVLYAHWEGFAKEAAVFYLEFVSRQRLTLGDLKNNFAAIACRSYFRETSESDKVAVQEKLIAFLRDNESNPHRQYD